MFIAGEKHIHVLCNGLHLCPVSGTSFQEQLDNCHEQLEKAINDLARHIVLIVYFVDARNQEVYNDHAAMVEKRHKTNYQSPYSVIAQSPVDGKKVNFEVYHCSFDVTPEFRQFEGYTYCIFNYRNNKYLVAGGLQLKTKSDDLLKQSMESFRLMKEILTLESMDFSHIFRQWNYIESITDTFAGSQRYQIFNDVRTLFYNESDFIHGYPAATGIGMTAGGVIIDFLASTQDHVWPVKNPQQVDAHKYSGEVLGNNKLSDKFIKSPPKFERAKAISLDDGIIIYVSGTAAIKGQLSIAQDDAYYQTLVTIDNIEQLTTIKNLIEHQIPVSTHSVVEPVSFRIYAKTLADIQKVQTAFKSRFGKMKNVQFLIADICRPELLVEIEGTFLIENSSRYI
jgi:enamine deaminase RidA (YjgF/YER057c/UK114 family)